MKMSLKVMAPYLNVPLSELLIEESDYLVASQLGLFVAAAGPEQGGY